MDDSDVLKQLKEKFNGLTTSILEKKHDLITLNHGKFFLSQLGNEGIRASRRLKILILYCSEGESFHRLHVGGKAPPENQRLAE